MRTRLNCSSLFENKTKCDAEYCTYSANPKATFSWFDERKSETFSCSFSPNESHLAVQASGIQIICNVSVLTTVEGIYLSRKINQDINNKVPQSSNVEEMKELGHSSSDSSKSSANLILHASSMSSVYNSSSFEFIKIISLGNFINI
ncbi:hypothetical protein BpHYR1_031188 [Brachionus plicatilis]|uniref:Uncharacterized protein n=1 Tax=Brachionus plicatilis TaxID=10195 RepID=A0A3M7R1E8_BRAPC|nr:hypothetical protein BpHYR1_031188 [Brachionus plicatilis]